MIFIYEPIKSEYQNIKKERDRIRSSYKNANVFLRKNARPNNELKPF